MVDDRDLESIEVVESSVEEQDDFLADVKAADPESFNVCISCD